MRRHGRSAANRPWLPLSEMDFVGCVAEPMTLAQCEAFEGRLEFRDSEAEIAFLVRDDPTMPRERAAHTLSRLVERIALVRAWAEPWGWWRTSRARGRAPGLTVFLLGEGGYAESAESRAFPGSRASEIHAALNESVVSAKMHRVLERVGRALGEYEGTGPDDDPLLRFLGRKKRAEGLAEGRAAGLAEGMAAGRTRGALEMVRELLRQRGVPVSPEFPAEMSPADRKALLESPEAVLGAALAAESEADFLRRLRGRS